MRSEYNEIGGSNRVPTLSISSLLTRFARCKSGATSIEYGLICSLIFLAIVSALQEVGDKTTGMHTKVQTSL